MDLRKKCEYALWLDKVKYVSGYRGGVRKINVLAKSIYTMYGEIM